MLDTLLNRRIAFLAPSTWADLNDREIMEAFAHSTPDRRVFAYCLAEGNETAHHWQVFADRGSGARIIFSRERLFSALNAYPQIIHGPVSYVKWKDLNTWLYPIEDLPFLKRSVFRFEREYRLIATTQDHAPSSRAYYVDIPLDCITSVYVSGEVPAPHFEVLTSMIREIPGCKRLRIRHSGLLRNASWSRSLSFLLRK